MVSVPLRKEDLQYDVDGMLKAITPKTKLILVINPNNPTGIFIDDKDLIRFCETGIPLCIDEAYLDYHPEIPSKDFLLKKYPQVFLSHTFSKAYGFAGIRFGYVVGTEEMVKAFNTMFLPWNVSLMAMAAAEAILDNPGGGCGEGEAQQPLDGDLRRGAGQGRAEALPGARQLHARSMPP